MLEYSWLAPLVLYNRGSSLWWGFMAPGISNPWAFFCTLGCVDHLSSLVGFFYSIGFQNVSFHSFFFNFNYLTYVSLWQPLPNQFEEEFRSPPPRKIFLTSHAIKNLRVEVERGSDGRLYLRRGWDRFVTHHGFVVGSSMTFFYMGRACFKVCPRRDLECAEIEDYVPVVSSSDSCWAVYRLGESIRCMSLFRE